MVGDEYVSVRTRKLYRVSWEATNGSGIVRLCAALGAEEVRLWLNPEEFVPHFLWNDFAIGEWYAHAFTSHRYQVTEVGELGAASALAVDSNGGACWLLRHDVDNGVLVHSWPHLADAVARDALSNTLRTLRGIDDGD